MVRMYSPRVESCSTNTKVFVDWGRWHEPDGLVRGMVSAVDFKRDVYHLWNVFWATFKSALMPELWFLKFYVWLIHGFIAVDSIEYWKCGFIRRLSTRFCQTWRNEIRWI